MSARGMFYPENKVFSEAEERAFAREELVYNVTEDLLVIMEDHEITKSELARKLGKSKSYVSQVLSGSRNMTLGSFSDICFALGFKPEIKLPVQEENDSIFYSFYDPTSYTKAVKSKSFKRMKIENNILIPDIPTWNDNWAA